VPPDSERPGPLPDPPADLDQRDLLIVDDPGPWFRVHRADRDPLFFGATGNNRFDAPAGEFGVCYLARDPYGAFIETFAWTTGIRVVTIAALAARSLARIETARSLRLVDLTGHGLARLGADERLSAGEHGPAQRWSRALWAHPDSPDGVLYRARHDPSRFSLAVYNRVRGVLRTTLLGSLIDPIHTELLAPILDHYRISLIEA
jgi:hypothetical protein